MWKSRWKFYCSWSVVVVIVYTKIKDCKQGMTARILINLFVNSSHEKNISNQLWNWDHYLEPEISTL